MSYHQVLPNGVLAKIPFLMEQVNQVHPIIGIEVASFEDRDADDNASLMFAVEVFHSPERVVPGDKRSKPYMTKEVATFYLNPKGEVCDTAEDTRRA